MSSTCHKCGDKTSPKKSAGRRYDGYMSDPLHACLDTAACKARASSPVTPKALPMLRCKCGHVFQMTLGQWGKFCPKCESSNTQEAK